MTSFWVLVNFWAYWGLTRCGPLIAYASQGYLKVPVHLKAKDTDVWGGRNFGVFCSLFRGVGIFNRFVLPRYFTKYRCSCSSFQWFTCQMLACIINKNFEVCWNFNNFHDHKDKGYSALWHHIWVNPFLLASWGTWLFINVFFKCQNCQKRW